MKAFPYVQSLDFWTEGERNEYAYCTFDYFFSKIPSWSNDSTAFLSPDLTMDDWNECWDASHDSAGTFNPFDGIH